MSFTCRLFWYIICPRSGADAAAMDEWVRAIKKL